MHYVVLVAIIQRTPNLPGELPRNTFPQSPMADDVVEHLAAADVLEHHVVVVLVDDHLSHTAYVGMVEQHRQRSFTKGPYLLRGILGRLLRRRVGRGRRCGPAGGHAGEDFDRELGGRSRMLRSQTAWELERRVLTFSPVML